ncbi:MAG: septum site-determining protein MinD [Ruminococcaceae bacterium]|nr:septum site-determining protein MinD [Oscillospiraceae bacterium]
MGEVYVVTSGKGGVGKTTVAANIGIGLSLSGKSVILIDTDIGLRNLDIAVGLENEIVYDIVDLINGDCDLKQAVVVNKNQKGLAILPAAQTKSCEDITKEKMIKLCEDLKSIFDYVIIDCPAGVDYGFEIACAPADKAIVVTTPDLSAMRDADRAIERLYEFGKDDIKLVVNKIYPKLMGKELPYVDEVLDYLRVNLLGVIPEDLKLVTANVKSKSVVTNEKSLSGEALRNIVKRIQGEHIPVIDFDNKRKMKKFL